MTEPTVALVRVGDFVRTGRDSREIRRQAEQGVLTRVSTGTYVASRIWADLDARSRHATRVLAVLTSAPAEVVASHWSAAALWNMPVLDEWPAEVEVIDPRRRTGVRSRTVVKRALPLADHDVVSWLGIPMTTSVRTACDLALSEGFIAAVMLFDHGLRQELFDRDELRAHLDTRFQARRIRAARAAVEFADPGAATPPESFSRVVIAERGLAAPVLQHPFYDERGKIGEVDFWWPEFGVVGEFDGDWKYDDARFLNGRSAGRVVTDEKERERRLRAHPDVRQLVRWDYLLSRNADVLVDRLVRAGVNREDRR